MGCCCIQNIRQVDQIQQNLTDSRVRLTTHNQALSLKQQGNDHFKKKAYQNAIKCYKQALSKNPKQLVYYTNLALAYKANNQFQEAIQVINQIQILSFPPSPNYSDLIAKGNLTKARCINSLAKKYIISKKYSKEQSQKMQNEIETSIKILQDIKKSSKIQVDEYLNNSLKIKIYLTKIKKKTSQSQIIDFIRNKIKQSKKGLHNQKNWQKIKDYYSNQYELIQQIENLYSKLHQKFIEEAQQDEQYLIDPITYQKFKDPVIVPSGITYQQEILKQYFKKGEYKDPITKQKFQIGQKVIVNNHSIKNYIVQMGKIHQIRKQDIQLLVC